MENFEVLEDFLPFRLSAAAWLVAQEFSRIYEPKGLGRADWLILAHLTDVESSAMSVLCNRAMVDAALASRAAKKLDLMGLVNRMQDEKDKRSFRLSLTAAGRKLFNDIVPEARAFEQELKSVLTEDEFQTTMQSLIKIEGKITAMRSARSDVSRSG